jgi:hypothetical protein
LRVFRELQKIHESFRRWFSFKFDVPLSQCLGFFRILSRKIKLYWEIPRCINPFIPLELAQHTFFSVFGHKLFKSRLKIFGVDWFLSKLLHKVLHKFLKLCFTSKDLKLV